jgi:2-polyprenyl-3-methyl-5-hydroxy-6-metoxy-1,4-benzoquinol methylase
MTEQPTFDHVFDEKLESCLICEKKQLSDYKRDWRDVLISRCSFCGFQFMNPQYEDRYIHQYYIDSYVDTARSKTHKTAYEPAYSLYLSLVERHMDPGRLLDIGCGNGSLLAVARERGWQISGYDVDGNSTKAVSERLGETNIFSGDFLELDESQQYDAITLHQVLEHVKNPNEHLQKIRRLLADGGYVFVAVPNIHSVSNKLKFILESIGVRRKNVGKYYDTYHHLLYFTPSTLPRLLTKHGFTPVHTQNCYKANVRESRAVQFVKNNITGRLFPSSAFLVVARKD